MDPAPSSHAIPLPVSSVSTLPDELSQSISVLTDAPILDRTGKLIVDAQNIETLEEHALRLLCAARAPDKQLDAAQQEELRLLAQMIDSRAQVWKNTASILYQQTKNTRREAERVQKLADTLAAVAAHFTKL